MRVDAILWCRYAWLQNFFGPTVCAYVACVAKDEFGGRESIFWAVLRP
jgi:hypothetical protein